jgi:hypothetical protein
MSQDAMVPNSWSLLDRGLLWKEVVKSAGDQESFGKLAEEFVKQLQEAAKPKNALEGLLLDRMACSYLRKVMLLDELARYKEHRRAGVRTRSKGRTAADIADAVLLDTSPSTLLYQGFESVLKYESDLDRGFQRDTFLLLQLQQLSQQSVALSSKKPAQSARKTVEGDTEKPAIG